MFRQACFQRGCSELLSDIKLTPRRRDVTCGLYCNAIITGAPSPLPTNASIYIVYRRRNTHSRPSSGCSSARAVVTLRLRSRPRVSAVKGWTIHDGMLHTDLRNCLSAAFIVHRLFVHESSAFDVWLSGLLCGWPNGPEFATGNCSWSDTFFWQFPARSKNL